MESDPTTMIHTAPAEIGQAHRQTTGPRPTVHDGPDSTCAPHPSLGPDNAPPSVGGNGRGVVAGAVNPVSEACLGGCRAQLAPGRRRTRTNPETLIRKRAVCQHLDGVPADPRSGVRGRKPEE